MGGAVVAQLDVTRNSLKDRYDKMWVSRKGFEKTGMRTVREKIPFIL